MSLPGVEQSLDRINHFQVQQGRQGVRLVQCCSSQASGEVGMAAPDLVFLFAAIVAQGHVVDVASLLVRFFPLVFLINMATLLRFLIQIPYKQYQFSYSQCNVKASSPLARFVKFTIQVKKYLEIFGEQELLYLTPNFSLPMCEQSQILAISIGCLPNCFANLQKVAKFWQHWALPKIGLPKHWVATFWLQTKHAPSLKINLLV